jgi:hypothetical protein
VRAAARFRLAADEEPWPQIVIIASVIGSMVVVHAAWWIFVDPLPWPVYLPALLILVFALSRWRTQTASRGRRGSCLLPTLVLVAIMGFAFGALGWREVLLNVLIVAIGLFVSGQILSRMMQPYLRLALRDLCSTFALFRLAVTGRSSQKGEPPADW